MPGHIEIGLTVNTGGHIEYRHFIGIKTHQLRGDIQNLTVKRIELISQCQLRGIHAFTI